MPWSAPEPQPELGAAVEGGVSRIALPAQPPHGFRPAERGRFLERVAAPDLPRPPGRRKRARAGTRGDEGRGDGADSAEGLVHAPDRGVIAALALDQETAGGHAPAVAPVELETEPDPGLAEALRAVRPLLGDECRRGKARVRVLDHGTHEHVDRGELQPVGRGSRTGSPGRRRSRPPPDRPSRCRSRSSGSARAPSPWP